MGFKIIATNSKGQQLTSGSWFSITKPIPHTPQVQYDRNVVYHVGKEKYIRRIWNKQFKD
jgi:hypothetical protein